MGFFVFCGVCVVFCGWWWGLREGFVVCSGIWVECGFLGFWKVYEIR